MTESNTADEYEDLCEGCGGAFPLVGQKLPDMELEVYDDDQQKKIRLKDFLGKWLVLLFYPADFTFVCPTELEDAADLYSEFQKEGAEILSVSTDSVYVHKAWHDTSPSVKKIKYPMVADPTAKLSQTLGVYKDEEGEDLRATFIIDPDGVIKSMEVHDNSIGRNIAETLRKLQAAIEVRKNGGALVCPANWHKGDKMLKKGMDLVGKI